MAMTAIYIMWPELFYYFLSKDKERLSYHNLLRLPKQIDLAIKSPGAIQCHHLNVHVLGTSTRCYIHSFKAEVILKGLNHIWALRPYCLKNVSPYYRSTHPLDAPYRICQVVSDEMSYENVDKLRRLTTEDDRQRKSRKETPQKLNQLSSRSHPRHLVGKRTAQKDITIDTTSDSQVNSNFPNRWSPASLTFNNYFYLF